MNNNFTNLVSIVMPVYNNELYIEDAIESVLKQSYPNFEFIIIDDGSTDETKNIIAKYTDERINLIINETNKGLIFSLNKGLSYVTGKYIARMDSDDKMLPDRLEKQVQFMENNENVFISGGGHLIMGTENIIFHPKYDAEIKLRLLKKSAFTHPAVIMRSSILKKHNLSYSYNYPSAEDYGLWVEVALLKLEMANIDEVLIEYRLHNSQISQARIKEQNDSSNLIRYHYFKQVFGNVLDESELSLLKDDAIFESHNIRITVPILSKIYYENIEVAFFHQPLFLSYIKRIIFANIENHRHSIKKDFLKIVFTNAPVRIKLFIFKYFLENLL